jgi:succinoglycan biosynthesis transport protein ExoP
MLHTYLSAIRRRWWLLPIGAVVAVAIAAAVNISAPPKFQSTAGLVVGGQGAAGDYWTLLMYQQLTKTYGELIQTDTVLEPVIAHLQLQMSSDELAKHVDVNVLPESRLINVTVDSRDPQQAAQIANAIGQQVALLDTGGGSGSIASLRQRMQADLDQNLQKSADGDAKLKDLDAKIAAAQASKQNTDDLVKQRDQLQSQMADLADSRLKLSDSLSRMPSSTVSLVTPATVSAAPSNQSLARTLLLALPLGLALAAAVAVVWGLLDTSIRSPEALPTDDRMPYLGSVPRLASVTTRKEALVARNQPRSPAAEAYRAIRTALRGLAPSTEPQVLLVTSSRPGEGKTTTAANLGVLLAQVGKRVMLVDADLRNPSLHLLFDVANGSGLTGALQGGAPEPVETGVERLRLLPSGAAVPHPAELLASRRMDLILQSLRSEADVILIDTPPVLSVTDAAVLAPRANEVVLVAGAGMATRAEVQRARDVLSTAGATFAGAILTRTDEALTRYYGTYHHAEPVAPVAPAPAQPTEPVPSTHPAFHAK